MTGCPRDEVGYCLVAWSGLCNIRFDCQHDDKTIEEKLDMVERERQRRIETIIKQGRRK